MMAKKMTKPGARAEIRRWIEEESITNRLEVKDRCRQCMDAPDVKRLVEQYWVRQANSIVASIRDKQHLREAFPVSSDSGVIIHHVSSTTDLHAIDVIERRCVGNIIGNQRTLAKARLRREELIEQLSLFPDIKKADG